MGQGLSSVAVVGGGTTAPPYAHQHHVRPRRALPPLEWEPPELEPEQEPESELLQLGRDDVQLDGAPVLATTPARAGEEEDGTPVRAWLNAEGLAHYSEAFRRHGYTGEACAEVLAELDENNRRLLCSAVKNNSPTPRRDAPSRTASSLSFAERTSSIKAAALSSASAAAEAEKAQVTAEVAAAALRVEALRSQQLEVTPRPTADGTLQDGAKLRHEAAAPTLFDDCGRPAGHPQFGNAAPPPAGSSLAQSKRQSGPEPEAVAAAPPAIAHSAQAGLSYSCLRKTALREAADPASARCGWLRKGETITAIEAAQDAEHGRQLRCVRGWVSITDALKLQESQPDKAVTQQQDRQEALGRLRAEAEFALSHFGAQDPRYRKVAARLHAVQRQSQAQSSKGLSQRAGNGNVSTAAKKAEGKAGEEGSDGKENTPTAVVERRQSVAAALGAIQ